MSTRCETAAEAVEVGLEVERGSTRHLHHLIERVAELEAAVAGIDPRLGQRHDAAVEAAQLHGRFVTQGREAAPHH